MRGKRNMREKEGVWERERVRGKVSTERYGDK